MHVSEAIVKRNWGGRKGCVGASNWLLMESLAFPSYSRCIKPALWGLAPTTPGYRTSPEAELHAEAEAAAAGEDQRLLQTATDDRDSA